MSTVKVGVIGLGTVGAGVARILTSQRDELRQKAQVDVELAKAVDLRPDRAAELGLDPAMVSADVGFVLDDPAIDIVVEVIGGIEPARTFILKAFESGKHVVTANKALISTHGRELLDAAAAARRDLMFEASVGGGIPIIHPLKESLVGNRIEEVVGIVNGTTNFVLTEMAERGCAFADALAEAQDRGYAEADPSADVDGLDAAAKIAILATIAFHSRVTLDQVSVEGIRRVGAKDITNARQMGYVIKLIALARRADDSVEVRVHPAMIPSAHPLASVSDVFNAIFVVGDSVGPVMFFGQGAGSLPAASAIVGDVVDIARSISHGCPGMTECSCFESLAVLPAGDTVTKFYVLMRALDRPGVLAKVADVFGRHGVSIASVLQKDTDETGADLVFITHAVREGDVRAALAEVEALDVVQAVENVIRVEEL